jgi:hypothetical protein
MREQTTASGLRILAIDPGPYFSAWCVLDAGTVRADKVPNADLLDAVRATAFGATALAVEMMAGSYGQAVGAETMLTALWIGRFVEAWEVAGRPAAALPYRKTVVAHLCGTAKAGDAHVRQALVDRFGGETVALARRHRCAVCKGKGVLKGQIACHCDAGFTGQDGPLRGFAADRWAALAVAAYWWDCEREATSG